MKGVWPAILVSGVSFAIPQFLISNYLDPVARRHRRIVDLDGLPGLLPQVWHPGSSYCRRARSDGSLHDAAQAFRWPSTARPRTAVRAFLPWVILSLFDADLGASTVKTTLASRPWMAPGIPGLHRLVYRDLGPSGWMRRV